MNIRKTVSTLRKIDRDVMARMRVVAGSGKLSWEESEEELHRLLEQTAALSVAIRVLKQLEA